MRSRLGLFAVIGGVSVAPSCSVDSGNYSHGSGGGQSGGGGRAGSGASSGGKSGAGTSGSESTSGGAGRSGSVGASGTTGGDGSGPMDEGGSAGAPSGGLAGSSGEGAGGGAGDQTGEGGQGGSIGGGTVGGRGGGNLGGGSVGGGGSGCGTGDVPATNACVISEARGVFVSPLGNDQAADGTRANPYATLTAGLAAAKAAGKRVYACAGTVAYQETLTIGASLDGAELYGGFECSTWAYSTSRRAELTSTATTALIVDALSTGLSMENFAITSANASAAGTSSIAVLVRNSQAVTFRRVTLQAGDGANGATGASGKAGASAATAGGKGLAPDCSMTPMPSPPVATNCSSKGGAGATFSVFESGVGPGAGLPQVGVTPAGVINGGRQPGFARVDAGAEFDGGNGGVGSIGNNGVNAPAVTVQGIFGTNGFIPPVGNDGVSGNDGQGGGGGGSGSLYINSVCNNVATGGGGGAGGCGGGFGKGGGGGGASVALLSYKSAVVLDSCSLVAGDGGNGGAGGNGGSGGVGSAGGVGGNGLDPNAPGYNPLSGNGGNGGDGGKGGGGGAGAGGAGGPSYAVVYNGAAPVQRGSSTLAFGLAGTGGPGGTSAASQVAPSGLPGVASPQFQQN